MTRRLLVTLIAVVLLAAGCGGGDGSPEDRASDTSRPSDDGGDDGGSTDGGGDVDCDAVRGSLEAMGISVQVLAQLRTQAQYDLVTAGTIALDPDEVLTAIEGLRPLEDVPLPPGQGSVADSLDLYEEAATLAKENLAVDDPFTEARGDELAALTENVSEFIGAQAPIAFALSEADC